MLVVEWQLSNSSNEEVEVGDDRAITSGVGGAVFLVLKLDDITSIDRDDNIASHTAVRTTEFFGETSDRFAVNGDG